MTRTDRRARTRRVVNPGDDLIRLKMRLGPDLEVLEVSDTSALVDASVRLAPGARLDVHVTTAAGRVLVRSRIIRSFVTQVRPTAMRYRAAMCFDQPIDIGTSAAAPTGHALRPAASTRELTMSG